MCAFVLGLLSYLTFGNTKYLRNHISEYKSFDSGSQKQPGYKNLNK